MNTTESDHNITEIQTLVRLLKRISGFHLIFVQCDWNAVRAEYLPLIQQKCDRHQVIVQEVKLTKTIPDLLAIPQEQDYSKTTYPLFLYGLEKSILTKQGGEITPFVERLNMGRDLLPEAFPYPVVIWLPTPALRSIATDAPDTWSWRKHTCQLQLTPDLLTKITDQFVELALNSVQKKSFLENETLSVSDAITETLLRPIEQEFCQKRDEEFVMQLIDITKAALGEFEEFVGSQKYIIQCKTFQIYLENLCGRSETVTESYPLPFAFPLIARMKELLVGGLNALNIEQEQQGYFWRPFNQACLRTFGQERWTHLFESDASEIFCEEEALYLQQLIDQPQFSLQPNEPPLKDIYVQETAYWLPYGKWDAFDDIEENEPIDDLDRVIDEYFKELWIIGDYLHNSLIQRFVELQQQKKMLNQKLSELAEQKTQLKNSSGQQGNLENWIIRYTNSLQEVEQKLKDLKPKLSLSSKAPQDSRALPQEIEENLKELQEQWAMLTQRLSRLENEKILSTQLDEQFQLDQQITKTHGEIQIVEHELTGLVSQLPSTQRVYSRYTENKNRHKILFLSAHYGVGKSTFLCIYAAQKAVNYLKAGEEEKIYIHDFEEYLLSFTLRQDITNFLTTLPNIYDLKMRQKLIKYAKLDRKLRSLIIVEASPLRFVRELMETFRRYGNLSDGRSPLEAILKAAKNFVGIDRREHCDSLINMLHVEDQQLSGEQRISSKLYQKVSDFLCSLPNIYNFIAQQAFLYSAGLDYNLISRIGVGEKPEQFMPKLVSMLRRYGKLKDGRDALEAVLKAAKENVGMEKQAYCDTLLQALRTISHVEAYRSEDATDRMFPLFIELKHFAGQDFNIEAYLSNVEKITLDPSRSYLFLLDALDESGPPAESHYNQIIGDCINLLDKYKGSQVIITSRPVLGPTGAVSQKIKTLNGKFLFLSGFDEEAINEYLGCMKQFDHHLPSELSYTILHDYLLRHEEDLKKPLFVNMLVQLFRNDIFSIKELKERNQQLTHTELYLHFLNDLSVRAKRETTEDRSKYQTYRYFLRKFAAKRQLNELDPFLQEKGIHLDSMIHYLKDSDKYLYHQIEQDKFHLISHFGKHGDYLEFIHLSFREYLVAEYLLEILLLNTRRNLSQKQELYLGYVSDETIDFFEGLINEFRGYIEKQEDKEKARLFNDFLHSVQIGCEEGLERYFDTEVNPVKLRRLEDLKNDLWEKTLQWAQDETLYLAGKQDEKTILGQPIQSSVIHASETHTYCERWFCVIFLQVWGQFQKEIPIKWDVLLRESMTSAMLNRRILRYCQNANLTKAHLKRLDLSNANFTGANFQEADLREVNLSGAILTDVNFSKTILGETKISTKWKPYFEEHAQEWEIDLGGITWVD